jgi:hypothetical protein
MPRDEVGIVQKLIQIPGTNHRHLDMYEVESAIPPKFELCGGQARNVISRSPHGWWYVHVHR